MKLLWLDLNSSYAHSSLALPALHAQIADDTTIEWCTVSATINENTGMVVNQIYHHQPDIIAATNWLFNHEQLLHIVSRAKALLPHCCIVLGGPEFLGNNEAFLRKNKFVNGVFRGEGEEVFPIWLKVWNHPVNDWNQISGLCYLDESDQYQDNGIARVMNFSQLVSPEKSRFFNWSKPFVQLETTRGCFNTCAFCVSGGEKPVRTISLEAIRERLNVIHQHGIKNVRVLDRTFNYNNKRAKELLHLFREYAPDICFHLEIHPALLSEELKEELAILPNGLLHLEAGIQSLREQVKAALENLPADWKTIDLLINNAGLVIGVDKEFEGSLDEWDIMIDTNIKGLLTMTRLVVPGMIERGRGHVINIGSIAGDAAYPGGSVYCATKAAVKALSDGLRIDLVDTPLRVTNIKPGMVETNFSVVRYRGDKQAADNFYKGIRPLTGEDVAETVYFAASAPEHIQIAEVLLMPTNQATGTISYKKKSE